MVSSGLGVVVAPLPLLAGAGLVYLLGERRPALARAAGLLGAALALVFLGLDAAVVAGGGRVEVSLAGELGGFTLLLRSDPAGVGIALAAATAGLLAMAEPGLRSRAVAGVLLCSAGGVVAGLAGDAITLFAGAELATLGTTLVLAAGRRRLGRGAVAALAIQHAGALGLISVAVQLQTVQGTTAFAVLPAGAVTATVAWPWAASAAIRLLAPALTPARGTPIPAAAWAATGAVPCAAAILLRLRDAAGGPLPLPVLVAMAAGGSLIALGAAILALRRRNVPELAGRAVAAGVAGPALAVAGLGAPAGPAVAAGLCALELAMLMSGAWERRPGGGARWLAPAALLASGGLPLGFGATALTLELGAVAALGRAAMALMVALVLGTVGRAAAAAAAAWNAYNSPPQPGAPSPAGVVALVAAAAGGLLPGAAVLLAVAPLSPAGTVAAADSGAVLGPGGGWAGGYWWVALLILVLGVGAALRVAGVTLPAPGAPRVIPPPGPVPLAGWRALRGPVALGGMGAAWLDAWLVLQPQLPLVLGGAVLALLLVH